MLADAVLYGHGALLRVFLDTVPAGRSVGCADTGERQHIFLIQLYKRDGRRRRGNWGITDDRGRKDGQREGRE
jgi:hypothetical protein